MGQIVGIILSEPNEQGVNENSHEHDKNVLKNSPVIYPSTFFMIKKRIILVVGEIWFILL